MTRRLRRSFWRGAAQAVLAAVTMLAIPTAGTAQDHSRIYTSAALAKDAERLRTAATKIYELGIKPSLRPDELQAIGDFELVFPEPEPGAPTLDFYAYTEDDRGYVALPIASLKALEDLTTAFAWLYAREYSHATIDLYYAMLRRETPESFPGGAYPAILPALGVPEEAWKEPVVDDLSLRLRNEAFAFVILHEFGHLRHDHAEYFETTPRQAQADEAEADRFALDVLARTATPAMGAMVLFQAQAYSLPHRGRFESDAAWRDFLNKRSSHPVTPDRLTAMGSYMLGPLAATREAEREIWTFIGAQLNGVADILRDEELQVCMAKLAETAPMDALKPRRAVAASLIQETCG